MTTVNSNREVTRTALERVCANGDMTLARDCYAEDFTDHIGTVQFHGHDGIRRSTTLYRALLDDLTITVADQLADGDRVANRWTLTGTNRGRPIRLTGITISRVHNGLITEDWTAFDTLDLLRALGIRRTLLAAPHLLRARRAASHQPT
jgi:ketosteroid isomerase-like protein